jgi:uncharacterized membrane protein
MVVKTSWPTVGSILGIFSILCLYLIGHGSTTKAKIDENKDYHEEARRASIGMTVSGALLLILAAICLVLHIFMVRDINKQLVVRCPPR